ncbi:hypothetical protein HDV02_003905 [Globomyces sp. JEL0801]|nr:hypothetical protein HDV02_003905 [Globomyces sp. JEL0801]
MIQDRLKRPQKPSIGKSESQNNIIPEQTSTRIMGQIRKQKQDHEPAPLKFVTGPPSTEHWKPDKMAKECKFAFMLIVFSDLETSDEDGALSITTGLDINSHIAETPIGTVPNDWTWSTF